MFISFFVVRSECLYEDFEFWVFFGNLSSWCLSKKFEFFLVLGVFVWVGGICVGSGVVVIDVVSIDEMNVLDCFKICFWWWKYWNYLVMFYVGDCKNGEVFWLVIEVEVVLLRIFLSCVIYDCFCVRVKLVFISNFFSVNLVL